MNLSRKVAIITGASSGIGAAVARELANAGMNLVVTARRKGRLDKLAKEFPGTIAVAGDITATGQPKRLLDAALNTFGRCDVVFNNAGTLEVAPLDTLDIERVSDMVRANVEAAYRMAYVAVKHFRSVNRGQLINTSSVLGSKVRATAGWYAGTKFAIEALSESLRMELAGTGVKVSCIEPGLVATELHDRWNVPPTKALKIKNPLQPDDVARCVRFLLEQPNHVLIAKLMVLPAEHQI